MVRYSVEEKNDMYELYIRNNKNSITAAQEYHRLYPERNQPSRTIFLRLQRNLRWHGSMSKVRGKYQKENHVNDINVIAQLHINPAGSCRTISTECGISKSEINRIARKHKYHDYKFTPVQTLHQGDSQRRVIFCRWFVGQLENDNNFPRRILWTDESNFTNCGMFNRRNKHHYATENPHLVQEVRNQTRFSINVWCGLIDNQIVGPYFFEGTLNGERYLNFLQGAFQDILDSLPLETIRIMQWFQQDGAPPHNAREVANYLGQHFNNRWIGTNGSVSWPPRSPCLSPLDFFLWGVIKSKVYETPTNSLEHLRGKIRNAFAAVSQNDVRKAIMHTSKRARLCLQQNGHNFQHLL